MDERRHDLDWLRIIAFGLLILYHIGMFYVTWDWHVKSSRAGSAIEPLMRLSNPWRLTLLFLIAGAATRFMADKLTPKEFTRSRMRRLWPPLLLAVFVIVPPQSYFEVVEALQNLSSPTPLQRSWLESFYLKYITASGQWCDQDGCLITPTYNHMWFVAYLIIYTLALVPLLPLLRKCPASIAKLIAGSGLILTPWLFLFAIRLTLLPIFGETHAIVDDWYLHALYFAAFLFGYAVAKHSIFFERCARLRWIALATTLVAWAVVSFYIEQYQSSGSTPPIALLVTLRGVRELQTWSAIIAMIGLAHHFLKNADGPVKRVLSQAIFPFYLVHQTIIVVAAHYLDEARWPLAIEAPLLIAITAVGCWLFYDLGRRVPALRLWIGLDDAKERGRIQTSKTMAAAE